MLDGQLEGRQSLLNLERLKGWIAETGQTLRLDLQLAIVVVLSGGACYRDRVARRSQDVSQSAVTHAVLVVGFRDFLVIVDVVEGVGEASTFLHGASFIDLHLGQQALVFLADQSVVSTTHGFLSTAFIIVDCLIVDKASLICHGSFMITDDLAGLRSIARRYVANIAVEVAT